MVVRTHEFTRADYYRLAEAGVLTEDDRYQAVTEHRPGATIAPEVFPDMSMPVETCFH